MRVSEATNIPIIGYPMQRDERKIINLISYGIDSALAKYLVSEGYGVTRIRGTSIKELTDLIGNEKAKAVKAALNREPIQEETVSKLVDECDWKCCICFDVNIIRPVIIHHIVKYSKTQDNNYDNLVVLCPDHHSYAHSKSELTGDLLPANVIRIRKKEFSDAISGWKEGLRPAPGREGNSAYFERQKEFLEQKKRVEEQLKKGKDDG